MYEAQSVPAKRAASAHKTRARVAPAIVVARVVLLVGPASSVAALFGKDHKKVETCHGRSFLPRRVQHVLFPFTELSKQHARGQERLFCTASHLPARANHNARCPPSPPTQSASSPALATPDPALLCAFPAASPRAFLLLPAPPTFLPSEPRSFAPALLPSICTGKSRPSILLISPVPPPLSHRVAPPSLCLSEPSFSSSLFRLPRVHDPALFLLASRIHAFRASQYYALSHSRHRALGTRCPEI